MEQEGQQIEGGQTTTEQVPAEGQENAVQTQGQDKAPKVYDEKAVSEIVSKRVNEINSKWSRFGKPEELEAKLRQYEAWQRQQAQAQQQPKATQTQETEADKQVREYLEKQGWARKDDLAQMQHAMQQMMMVRAQELTVRNESSLKDVATKAGYTEEQFTTINELVANSIRGNPQDLAAYQRTGSFEIVKKHFDAIHNGLASMEKARAAAYAKEKQKVNSLPPKMPAGGVHAPTSKTQKMDDKQRIAAAFERFQKGPAA